VEGHLRVGRSVEAKRSLIERTVEAVAQAAAMPKNHVWAHLVDMPASQMAEFGHVLPEPGGEAAWIAALPEAERKEIEAIGLRPSGKLAGANAGTGLAQNRAHRITRGLRPFIQALLARAVENIIRVQSFPRRIRNNGYRSAASTAEI
jgi:hypothetical protein